MPLLHESLRPTAQHWRILLFAWLVWLTGFASLMLMTFVLEPIKKAFGPSEIELAWLTGLAIGATGVGGFVFGALADRAGRRPSMAIALLAFAAGNLASALAPSFAALAAARVLAGLGIGGAWGAGQAMIGETFPPALRGRYAAYAQSGAPLGLGLATVVGTFVAPLIGWRGAFGLGVLPLLLLLLLPAVPESDVWHAAGRGHGLGAIARSLVSSPVGSLFLRCLVLTTLAMSNYYFMLTWLPRYLQVERGLSLARSGWATLAFVAGAVLGYPAFGFAADVRGRRIAFTLFSLLTAGALLMFTVFYPLIAGHPRLVLVFLFAAGVGTGIWSLFGPMMAEVFPTRVRGSAMSIIMNSTRGVQFVAPVVIAAVAPLWGMAGGIALAAGFAVLAAAWVWTLPETRGRAITAADDAAAAATGAGPAPGAVSAASG
ncbi:MAG TPA: MFS transporter [Thermoanaerobaculia bacterium]|jgi:MFS family permease|nr:MFS transporter [Thermoanaerobaculia bacterium]